jgi:uncharacterized membrane protein YdjX (TVP38/TMEM64 family)
MKKAVAIACALALGATALYAGGPVVIENVEVAEEKPVSSSGALLPIILLAVIGLAIASGDNDAPQGCVAQ